MPLFPDQRQRWVVRVRLGPKQDPEDAIRAVFQEWTNIFPGAISEPDVLDDAEPFTETIIEPPPLGFRGPSQDFVVEFDYTGTDDRMRWPTFVARRRERVQATCPIDPVDTMPIAVQQTGENARGDDRLPGRTPPGEDPLAIDVPPIDTDALSARLRTFAWVGGIAAAGVLLLALRGRKYR